MLEATACADLYEPAAGPLARARLHLGEHTLFVGALGPVASHVHATAVLVVGLYEEVGVRQSCSGTEHAPWHRGQAVVVPAGVAHELHAGDAPVAVFYPSRMRADEQTLAGLLSQRRPGDASSVFGVCGASTFFRDWYEHRSWPPAAADEALGAWLASHRPSGPIRSLDPRVQQIMAQLHEAPQGNEALAAVAASHGLSSSRLMHLFAEQLNTPFRRYRTWCRLQMTMREASTGLSLTQAALAAGFSDSQHFSREFRRAFGLTASEVMRRIRTP